MTEKDRIAEWLTRVAVDLAGLKIENTLTKEEKLHKIKSSYEILSVMIKVAQGRAYIVGIQPLGI